MTLHSIAGNTQRPGGGVMSGDAPWAMWRRWTPADAEDRIPMACRCVRSGAGHDRVPFGTGAGGCLELQFCGRRAAADARAGTAALPG